jgi:hypothetical protein
VRPIHGVSVHVLRQEAVEKAIANTFGGEEDQADSSRDIEERFVLDSEGHLVDRFESLRGVTGGAAEGEACLGWLGSEVLEGVRMDTKRTVELSEFKEVKRGHIQDRELYPKELLLRGVPGTSLNRCEIVVPIEDFSKFSFWEMPEGFSNSRSNLRLLYDVFCHR